jgi:predicted dehydrogenase
VKYWGTLPSEEKTMINIGVVGYGYWGPNLVRNFTAAEDAKVHTVVDRDKNRLRVAKIRNPSIEVATDFNDILVNTEIDAVAVATPVSSHYELAMQALRAGKHVFVEKPFTQTSAQARTLINEAEKRGLVLHVDHTFIYTGAVRKIRELVETGELGQVFYWDSVRVNLGLFQPDVCVIWDLAVHDLAILDYIFPATPVAVSATGASHIPSKPADVAYVTLFYEHDAIAHLHLNWLSPVKVRRSLIGGSRKMVLYDDVEPSEKIKVYDKGITLHTSKEELYNALVDYRMGDMYAPHLDGTEALSLEAQHFAHCIAHGERPLTDGYSGLRVVRILEAATRSRENRGAPVELDGRDEVEAA